MPHHPHENKPKFSRPPVLSCQARLFTPPHTHNSTPHILHELSLVRWLHIHTGNDLALNLFDCRVPGTVGTVDDAHTGCINSLRFHPTREYELMSSGFDARIRVFLLASGSGCWLIFPPFQPRRFDAPVFWGGVGGFFARAFFSILYSLAKTLPFLVQVWDIRKFADSVCDLVGHHGKCGKVKSLMHPCCKR